MRPDAKYHDEPCSMPFQGQKNCTMCPQTTRWMCWGCNLELGEVFPVCSPSTGRNCFAETHKLRTDIWDWIFYDTDTKNEYVHTLNMKKRWKVHDYKLEKMWFSRVRALRACPHNFYFDHCVYNTLVLCFTKEFLWNFVQEKIILKNSENMLFFVKMTEIQIVG